MSRLKYGFLTDSTQCQSIKFVAARIDLGESTTCVVHVCYAGRRGLTENAGRENAGHAIINSKRFTTKCVRVDYSKYL